EAGSVARIHPPQRLLYSLCDSALTKPQRKPRCHPSPALAGRASPARSRAGSSVLARMVLLALRRREIHEARRRFLPVANPVCQAYFATSPPSRGKAAPVHIPSFTSSTIWTVSTIQTSYSDYQNYSDFLFGLSELFRLVQDAPAREQMLCAQGVSRGRERCQNTSSSASPVFPLRLRVDKTATQATSSPERM